MYSVCLHSEADQSIMRQWSNVLHTFPPDKVFIVGEEKIERFPFRDAIYINNLDDLVFGGPIIAVTPKGEISLSEFSCYENSLYVFGHNDRHFMIQNYDFSVYIETAKRELFAHTAAAIVMYNHRRAFDDNSLVS